MADRARVFLLSPARLDGQRGKQLFQPVTLFPVARALRTREGCPIGEVFRFVSGLYFRGKGEVKGAARRGVRPKLGPRGRRPPR